MGLIIEWVGDDLWNIGNLPNPELYRLYERFYSGNGRTRRETIRRLANDKRNKLKHGRITMPERSEPFDRDLEPERIEQRRSRLAKNLAGKAVESTVITVPLEHLPYHEKLQKALDEDGAVTKARFSEYQMLTKDNEGEAQVHDLKAFKFEVAFDSEPKWPPLQRREGVKLPQRERSEKDKLRTSRRAVVFPDLQIPFHDEKALQIALEIARDTKPDKIVILGDLLDLSSFSKYIQRPEWVQMTQPAIDRAQELMETLRLIAPSAEIVVLEGNHDARMTKHALTNSLSSFGLRRGNKPDEWPVQSVPYLTCMDNYDIQYLSGYPANRYWINENLQVRHGHRVKSAGSTAKLVSDDERVSTIFGHVHRIETQFKTHHTYDGGKTNAAYSIGCLCKLDGSVPSVHSGVDLSGKPVTNYENWQQAVCVVEYEDGDSTFDVSPIYINTFKDYQAIYNGKKYSL